MTEDKLAQKWGAYGGDRRLSPHFPKLDEARVRRRSRLFVIAIWMIALGSAIAVVAASQ
jgi:type VI protein secretion system component VasF